MRNVLVTGGSRGIGLAIARRLAASGDYNVVAVARHESEELAAAVREGQRRLHFRACDLADTETIPAFAKSVRDEFGAIYGLVNNAGIGTDGLLATMHNSEIEALIRLNVLSPIILTKYVARHMMADGAGRIVNIPLSSPRQATAACPCMLRPRPPLLASPVRWPEKLARSASP